MTRTEKMRATREAAGCNVYGRVEEFLRLTELVDMAGELTKTNPLFNQRRFLKACGVIKET